MSTPTATPRTDNAWRRYNSADQPDPQELAKEMITLETALTAERERVRVLRSALERRHDEQSYYCQYVEDALAATKEECERIKVIATEQNDIAEQHRRELAHLRAEVERLKELLRIESASAQHALAAAERAEADRNEFFRDKVRLDWLLDRSAQTHHSYSNPLGGGNYVQYHKDRAAIDAAMKEGSK